MKRVTALLISLFLCCGLIYPTYAKEWTEEEIYAREDEFNEQIRFFLELMDIYGLEFREDIFSYGAYFEITSTKKLPEDITYTWGYFKYPYEWVDIPNEHGPKYSIERDLPEGIDFFYCQLEIDGRKAAFPSSYFPVRIINATEGQEELVLEASFLQRLIDEDRQEELVVVLEGSIFYGARFNYTVAPLLYLGDEELENPCEWMLEQLGNQEKVDLKGKRLRIYFPGTPFLQEISFSPMVMVVNDLLEEPPLPEDPTLPEEPSLPEDPPETGKHRILVSTSEEGKTRAFYTNPEGETLETGYYRPWMQKEED